MIDQAIQEAQITKVEGNPTVMDFIAAVRELPNQIQMPVQHHFIPGFYCRQIFMEKDSLAVSKLHKTTHPWVQLSGDCSVWCPDSGVKRYRGYNCGITTPGTQRILYMHEDTVWIAFHRTDETDLAKIEAEIIEPQEIPALPYDHPIMLELVGIKQSLLDEKE